MGSGAFVAVHVRMHSGVGQLVSCLLPPACLPVCLRPLSHHPPAQPPGGPLLPPTCVDVEQVVAGHAGLAWHPRGDDHQVTPIQRICQLAGAGVGGDAGGGGDVGEVGSHPRGVGHIVQAQLLHMRAPAAAWQEGKRWAF